MQVQQLIEIAHLIKDNTSLQTLLITTILNLAEKEAAALLKILKKVTVSSADTKVKGYWKTLDGVRKEKKILGIAAKLEEEKSALALCIAAVDSKLLHSVHLEVVKVQSSVDEFVKELPAIRDIASQVTTLLPSLAYQVEGVYNRLPGLESQISTIQDKFPVIGAIGDKVPILAQMLEKVHVC